MYNVYYVCTLLKVVLSYYDLSVLSMSVMGLKKNWMWVCGWVGGVRSIQVYY